MGTWRMDIMSEEQNSLYLSRKKTHGEGGTWWLMAGPRLLFSLSPEQTLSHLAYSSSSTAFHLDLVSVSSPSRIVLRPKR